MQRVTRAVLPHLRSGGRVCWCQPLSSRQSSQNGYRRIRVTEHCLLGNSVLRVFPICLGTMTFSTNWGRGADADEARRTFDAYVERGGDLIDTAVNYTDSECERLVGRLTASHRERLIVSTKSTMSRTPSDPNSGGNHRLNMVRSVEASLRHLERLPESTAPCFRPRQQHRMTTYRSAAPAHIWNSPFHLMTPRRGKGLSPRRLRVRPVTTASRPTAARTSRNST